MRMKVSTDNYRLVVEGQNFTLMFDPLLRGSRRVFIVSVVATLVGYVLMVLFGFNYIDSMMFGMILGFGAHVGYRF